MKHIKIFEEFIVDDNGLETESACIIKKFKKGDKFYLGIYYDSSDSYEEIEMSKDIYDK